MEFKWNISQMDCKIKETIDGQELQNVVNVVLLEILMLLLELLQMIWS